MSSLLTMYSLLVSHCMCLDRCYLCELLQPLWPSGFVLTALQLPQSCSHFPSGELQLSLWTPHPFRFVENTVWILWIPLQCPHQRELLLWHIFFCFEMSCSCWNFSLWCWEESCWCTHQRHCLTGVGAVTLSPSQRGLGPAGQGEDVCSSVYFFLFLK